MDEMPDFARAKIEFYMFLYGSDWRKIALNAANQMIGAISKLQRRTELKVLTHFVARDEEKLILLREVCEAIEEYCAGVLRETCDRPDCFDPTEEEPLEDEEKLGEVQVA